jgi:hypothetical protein
MELDPKKVKHLLREVEAVLWEDWDPIGVNDTPEAKGEYDGYAGAVFSVAFKTRSAIAVADHLVSIEHVSMGFERRDPKTALPVAEKILKIVEKI